MLKMQIALFFADGRAYFAGIVLVIISLLLLARRRQRQSPKPMRIMLGVGALLILLSSTPVPIWFYFLWLVTTLAWLIHQADPVLRRGPRTALFVSSLLFCVIAAAIEIPNRRMPTLGSDPVARLCVIGDSLTAGVGAGEKTWPKMLAEGGKIEVADLSEPGATAATAVAQAAKVPSGPAVIVIEIGGNDLLGGTSTADFERDLRRLLEALQGTSRRIIMFELPLPPFSNGYGRTQRRLANEFGAVLIPKSVLAGVIGSARTTLDGLHLSEAGRRELAEAVRKITGIPAPAP
jgi:acyl-CoA thioesterase I